METTKSNSSESDVNAKWDACLDLTARRFVYSSLGGAFAGLLFFSSVFSNIPHFILMIQFRSHSVDYWLGFWVEKLRIHDHLGFWVLFRFESFRIY